MFAKIAYKQNINMCKTNFSLQHFKIIMGTKLFFRSKTIFANNVLKYFFNYFGIILKFPELETLNLNFPELGSFGT